MIQNFLMSPILPHWSWENPGHVPLTSKPGPGTSSATLDNISHLLGKLGATQQWETGTSTCFSKLFCTCLLLGCFHNGKTVSNTKSHSTTKLPQGFSVKGEVPPHTLLFLTAAPSIQKHSQSLCHTLHDHPLLSNEHWDQRTEAEDRTSSSIVLPHQIHPLQPNPLIRGSSRLLTLQNHLTVLVYSDFPNRDPKKLPGT